MEIEKAIERLKYDKENFEELLKEDKPSTIKKKVESIIKSHSLAISALEKQIPSKIDYSELNYSNLPVSKCPECKNTTVNRLLQCNYCPDCGQRLDWEVEDEH